jgi:hypothetical protein
MAVRKKRSEVADMGASGFFDTGVETPLLCRGCGRRKEPAFSWAPGGRSTLLAKVRARSAHAFRCLKAPLAAGSGLILLKDSCAASRCQQ